MYDVWRYCRTQGRGEKEREIKNLIDLLKDYYSIREKSCSV